MTMCVQVPKALYKSPDNGVAKGHLLCEKQILLTQAEMLLVQFCLFVLFNLTLPMSQILDLKLA